MYVHPYTTLIDWNTFMKFRVLDSTDMYEGKKVPQYLSTLTVHKSSGSHNFMPLRYASLIYIIYLHFEIRKMNFF